MSTVEQVTVSLTDDKSGYPEPGTVQIVTRATMTDKNMIDHAANVLGMKQSEFTRIVLIRAAFNVLLNVQKGPRILKKLGKSVPEASV